MENKQYLLLGGLALTAAGIHENYPGGLGRFFVDHVKKAAERNEQPKAPLHSDAVLVGRECLKCGKAIWGVRCDACDPYIASPSTFRRGQLKSKSRRAKARKLHTGREPLPESRRLIAKPEPELSDEEVARKMLARQRATNPDMTEKDARLFFNAIVKKSFLVSRKDRKGKRGRPAVHGIPAEIVERVYIRWREKLSELLGCAAEDVTPDERARVKKDWWISVAAVECPGTNWQALRSAVYALNRPKNGY